MKTFKVVFTGDLHEETKRLAQDESWLRAFELVPYILYSFINEQKPDPGNATYWRDVYCMQIKPEHIAGVNGLVVCRPWVKASAFSNGAEDLVVIGRAGAGYDKLDLAACTANDVVVFNSPHSLTHSTASAALLFMLALAKRLPQQERLVHTGRWDLQASAQGDDLPGQTLGIIGLGNTGRELARLAAPFRMRILSYSPHAEAASAEALGVTLVSTLDILLRESDFVSLHCRLEERTRGMLGERELRLMKPTAWLINVARGELVEQSALVRCLRERSIAGAALDVYEVEPLPADDPLTHLDNVILTPHYVPATRQAGTATMESIRKGILAVAQGHLPDHVLNREVLTRSGFQAKLAQFSR